jgi:hypothetical protein
MDVEHVLEDRGALNPEDKLSLRAGYECNTFSRVIAPVYLLYKVARYAFFLVCLPEFVRRT